MGSEVVILIGEIWLHLYFKTQIVSFMYRKVENQIWSLGILWYGNQINQPFGINFSAKPYSVIEKWRVHKDPIDFIYALL